MRHSASRALSFPCLAALLLVGALEGCGGGRPSVDQAREEFYKNNPEIASQRKQVAKFSGRVTVDGQAPPEGVTLFVVLNSPDHPEAGAKVSTACDAQGNFEFKTYQQGDGVPIGKYVLEFVGLHKQKIRGRAAVVHFVGPDALKNLYNDPERNKDNPTFLLDVEAPGRADYAFDLKVAEKDAVTSPGPKAVTKITGV
jgi:hypothetical protein